MGLRISRIRLHRINRRSLWSLLRKPNTHLSSNLQTLFKYFLCLAWSIHMDKKPKGEILEIKNQTILQIYHQATADP